jgi:predicted GNAT family acetyltransferase
LHLLDNPVWNALNSADSHLNIGNEEVAYFSPTISPFVGLPHWSSALQQVLHDQLPATGSWSTVVAKPIHFIESWELVFTLTLHQMVCEKATAVLDDSIPYRSLGTTDIPAMLALTAITKPGPFLEKTILFGNYYGVFEDNKLIAMAGERLHLNNYSEISAVCTDPGFTGKGLAAFLVSMLSMRIFEQGKIPFLHVKRDNQRAINMYERLGFKHRSDMYFGVFKRK